MCIIGLGRLGITTAAYLAARGFRVIGVDTDKRRLAALLEGRTPFIEVGLPSLLRQGLKGGNLELTSEVSPALHSSQIVFITVGTPSKRDGSIDLKDVKAASASLGNALRESGYRLIVVKSTVVPGCTDTIIQPILEKNSCMNLGEFGLAVSPEFLREGSAVADITAPSRIIIGSNDPEAMKRLEGFYSKIYGDQMPSVIKTNPVTAELVKYASNSFLATKISFINEIADLCNALPGADVSVVAHGMGLDDRIGPQYLGAGLGYGGSCLPKDTSSLIAAARIAGVRLRILEAAEECNSNRLQVVVELAKGTLKNLKEKRIALLGVAFKPGTDDVRGAVSVRLANEFLREGSKVVVYDPVAIQNFRLTMKRTCEYASSAITCVTGADCCVLVTEWEEFRRMKPQDFKGMKTPFLIDGRRIYDPSDFMPRMNFAAIGLGDRPNVDFRRMISH